MSQSVTRAARILDVLAADPQTVPELAVSFDLHRSTMFRELQARERVGFVRRRKDGRYSLGVRLIALGQTALNTLDLREAGSSYVRQLHKSVGNTVHMAALMDSTIVYVDKVDDAQGMRMYSRVGAPVRAYCSGIGKVILADLDVPERDAILADTEWVRYTESTITSREALDDELVRVSAQGWAVDDGEFEDFVNCVAVPIRASAGIVGALSVTAVRMVQNIEQLRRHIPLMQQTAERIGRALG